MSLKIKHQLVEEGTLSMERETKPVPLKGLTRVSNCKEAVTEPWQILKFPEKQSKPKGTAGTSNDKSHDKSRKFTWGASTRGSMGNPAEVTKKWQEAQSA